MQRNPFKDRYMRSQYSAIARAYEIKDRLLFRADGSRCRGNSWACDFWRGYDGIDIDFTGMKQTGAYAAYRAGKDVAKAEGLQ